MGGSLGRPQTILRSGAATIASYTYNAAGQRDGFNGGVATAYSYDGLDQVTSISNTLANATYNNAYGFQYNPASQIKQLTRSNTLFSFAGLYTVNRGYTVNGLNQYTSAGPASFLYDANGNLTSDGSATFLYDIENRLVGAGGSRNVALRYDPLGRLYESAGPSGTVRFLYDGDALVGEYDTGGTLLQRYIHGADGAADDPIAWYEGAGFSGSNERILRPDWQGSIALISDNTGSQVFGVNTYDEYGIPGANNIGRFQYTGQAWQRDLGLYYYKARFYSPTLGRFLQTDPIGYDDQVNLYAYVANDPVNRTDRFGLKACPASDKNCVDDPATEHGATPQPGPDDKTKAKDDIVVTARKKKKFSDGTPIRFPSTGYLEQGFRVANERIDPLQFTRSGTQTCSNGTSRAANSINTGDIGSGNSGGHTHGGGELNPLPGPEDGTMAGATGQTAYQMSSRGAFAIESTSVGYRVRMLSGGRLSGSERAEIGGLIGGWNKNNGGSGVRCTFTPN